MASVSKRKWTYNGVEKERWTVRYFDERGVRRSKQYEQKKAADAFKRKVEREIEDGLHVAEGASASVAVVCGEYLKQAEQRLLDGRIGRNRYEHLVYSFNSCIIPEIGHIVLRDLREKHIDDMYRQFVSSGRMAPLSARQRVQDLKLIETFAIKRGYIKTQPATIALKDLHGLKRTPISTFSPEQVCRLLDLSGQRGHRRHSRTVGYLQCFVHLAALCGLRRGEIAGLTIANVDTERRVIEVRHNLTRHRELKGPKTRAGIRDVPMPALAAQLVRAWLDEFYVENDQGIIFTTDKGEPYTPANLHDAWKVLLKRAGLYDAKDTFHFHALRHFYASMLIDSGAPLTDTAKLMGHSAFDMTLQIYAHSVLKPEQRHALVDHMVSRMPMLTDAREAARLDTAA